MDAQPRYDIPWELIAAELLNDPSPEQAAALEQWLSLSPENLSAYHHIRETWKGGLEDYLAYREADGERSWKALQERLKRSDAGLAPEPLIIKRRFSRAGNRMTRWAAVAAALLLLFGIAFWQYRMRSGPVNYETSAGQQIRLTLSDGSSIVLKPLTRLTIPRSFNRQTRTVRLDKGEAFFDVRHSGPPFIVDMGVSSVRDIGTRFMIRKGEDSITVTVSSGKVEFVKNATSESKELTKGMTLSFSVPGESFGIVALAKPDSGLQKDSLRFNGASLQEVISAILQVYGKKLEVKDSSLLQKRLTADLGGLSFEDALNVVCNSLNLQYSRKNGDWLLQSRH